MNRVPASKWLESLKSEAHDIEKELDRGQNTITNIQRLEEIEKYLATIEGMRKKKLNAEVRG